MDLPRNDHLTTNVRGRIERPLSFLKTIAARSPRLALPLAWLQGKRELIDGDTDILIESFPRSGSSFAVAAFRLAQEAWVPRIASQTHASGHVIAAVRREIPALVLIREPLDAVVSNLFRQPERGVDEMIRGYLRFYEPLLPHRTGFVVATFQEVIEGGFGSVIRRVNTRFGTGFAEFEATKENVDRCLEWIDEGRRHGSQDGVGGERTDPLLSGREELKNDLRWQYLANGSPRLRARAESVYEQLA